MRWSVLAGALVAWNALLIADWCRPDAAAAHPGLSVYGALLLLFVLSVGTLTSASIQKLVLKPNRNVGEVRPFLRLLAFISGLLLFLLLLRPLVVGSRGMPNQRATLDAGSLLCYISDVSAPARVSAVVRRSRTPSTDYRKWVNVSNSHEQEAHR